MGTPTAAEGGGSRGDGWLANRLGTPTEAKVGLRVNGNIYGGETPSFSSFINIVGLLSSINSSMSKSNS